MKKNFSLYLPLLSFFLSFSLTPCLSFYLFSRSLSHPCLFLLSHTHIFLSISLPSPFLFLQSLFLSLPLLYLFSSFLPSLSSSSLSPTHFSLSIFVSSLSLLLPLCGSLSSTPISLPIFLSPTDVSFFHILSLSHASLSFSLTPVSLSWLNMLQSCRMVSTVLYFYYITLIIYILYYLVFKILSSFVRDSSYYDMYYKGCGLLCAHKKSFNTAILLPVRSLGPYMYVHYCTCIVHILV